MARKKKTSKTLEAARTRLAGLKSINENLDLGDDVKMSVYEAKINGTNTSLETYNSSLSVADANQDIFETDEDDLKDYHERILLAVAVKYGKDSLEYQKAGGVRKSERRKPKRDKTPPTT